MEIPTLKATTAFNEWKRIPGSGVSKIEIFSNHIDVYVQTENSNHLTTHLFGTAELTRESNITMDVRREGDKAKIWVKLKGPFTNRSMALYVMLPSEFKSKLLVTTRKGDIFLSGNLKAENIEVTANMGNISVGPTFKSLTAYTQTGDICISGIASCDKRIDVVTRKGNIDVEFGNVDMNRVLAQSRRGETIIKRHSIPKGFSASGTLVSNSGNITVS